MPLSSTAKPTAAITGATSEAARRGWATNSARMRSGAEPLVSGLAKIPGATVHQALRALIRGLNPPVLADHGLVAAIEDYAGRFLIPVTVDLKLPERLPRKLETTMYYLINEAMTNIAKHSGAETAAVHGRYHSDLLVLDIKDDGRGGLDPAGSGVTGLADRVTALDGRMRVSSPSGGPTLLHVEVPCRFA
ncbi:hypothetical protein OG285_36400 (plasmid) [Streptomyces sp. NBC_01471]|uniref:sensor histidine kinase n=1 Tax=Streptomyces sp. NBC_01471 TaxID=2903879 RepID=UPI002F914DA4